LFGIPAPDELCIPLEVLPDPAALLLPADMPELELWANALPPSDIAVANKIAVE
jgi:hypothetical protein